MICGSTGCTKIKLFIDLFGFFYVKMANAQNVKKINSNGQREHCNSNVSSDAMLTYVNAMLTYVNAIRKFLQTIRYFIGSRFIHICYNIIWQWPCHAIPCPTLPIKDLVLVVACFAEEINYTISCIRFALHLNDIKRQFLSTIICYYCDLFLFAKLFLDEEKFYLAPIYIYRECPQMTSATYGRAFEKIANMANYFTDGKI